MADSLKSGLAVEAKPIQITYDQAQALTLGDGINSNVERVAASCRQECERLGQTACNLVLEVGRDYSNDPSVIEGRCVGCQTPTAVQPAMESVIDFANRRLDAATAVPVVPEAGA